MDTPTLVQSDFRCAAPHPSYLLLTGLVQGRCDHFLAAHALYLFFGQLVFLKKPCT